MHARLQRQWDIHDIALRWLLPLPVGQPQHAHLQHLRQHTAQAGLQRSLVSERVDALITAKKR